MSKTLSIYNVKVQVLHLNHMIANKKAVNRLKDQVDVLELEKILKLIEMEKS